MLLYLLVPYCVVQMVMITWVWCGLPGRLLMVVYVVVLSGKEENGVVVMDGVNLPTPPLPHCGVRQVLVCCCTRCLLG